MTTPPQHPGQDPRDPQAGGPPRYVPPAGGDRHSAPQGQYGAPQGQYGPGPHGAQGPAAPPQLKRLLSLTLLSAALYAVSSIVSLVASSTMDMTSMAERMGMPADQAQQAEAMAGQSAALSVVSGLVTLAIALGLYALVYVFVKKGRNWARILGVVLASLSALSVLFGFLGYWLYGGWGVVLMAVGVAFVVVNVLWIVTAFRAPLNQWFTRPQHAW
ncbi:hypothetical protein MRU69_04500 [Kocuria flava]|uniref:hypothetical protein n=1 Tax=Kocuria flava TaxID=446860 RepID=UPI001FF6974E|nr:hypothetical protein [Kocuria flava]MCJ8504127.1 hypothetical protein [Kocuria flava]